eukprot:8526416-Pyramimonas_sp.AAC.1
MLNRRQGGGHLDRRALILTDALLPKPQRQPPERAPASPLEPLSHAQRLRALALERPVWEEVEAQLARDRAPGLMALPSFVHHDPEGPDLLGLLLHACALAVLRQGTCALADLSQPSGVCHLDALSILHPLLELTPT